MFHGGMGSTLVCVDEKSGFSRVLNFTSGNIIQINNIYKAKIYRASSILKLIRYRELLKRISLKSEIICQSLMQMNRKSLGGDFYYG